MKMSSGKTYHSWDINTKQYCFEIHENSKRYEEINAEIHEAVKTVFQRHYGNQEGTKTE